MGQTGNQCAHACGFVEDTQLADDFLSLSSSNFFKFILLRCMALARSLLTLSSWVISSFFRQAISKNIRKKAMLLSVMATNCPITMTPWC
jgi:hypothetical protein